MRDKRDIACSCLVEAVGAKQLWMAPRAHFGDFDVLGFDSACLELIATDSPKIEVIVRAQKLFK